MCQQAFGPALRVTSPFNVHRERPTKFEKVNLNHSEGKKEYNVDMYGEYVLTYRLLG